MADPVLTVRLEGAPEVQARLARLGSTLPGVLSRAINRTGERARTETQRAITAQAGFPAKRALALIKLLKAGPDTLQASLKVSEFRQPLIAYVGSKGFRSGRGIGGRAYRIGTVPPGAFFAQARSGHRGIFARLRPTKSRKGRGHAAPGLPIDELKGPSLADVIRRFGIWESLTPRLQQIFAERLQHEVGRAEGIRAS